MADLKIYCKGSTDARYKLNILAQYGFTTGEYEGEISGPAFYILDKETKELKMCWPASADGIKDIPEVCYDFFRISDQAREKAYSNCEQRSRDIIYMLTSTISEWFVWDETPERHSYWSNWHGTLLKMDNPQIEENAKIPTPTFKERNIVIADTKELIKEYLNNSLTSKELHYESRLQEQETYLSGRDGAEPVRFHGGKHQVRIASKHLSYQKAVGRG